MSDPTGNYATRAIHGDTWTAREIAGGYVLSVHTGNELVAAVTEFVASQGISGGSITSQAFGETSPRVPTADGVREPQNRRVEITYGPGSGR